MACLHVPAPSPSQFIIVSMEMDHLTDRMDSVPILSVKWTVSTGTMINFDGDGDGHRDGDGTCKQALSCGKVMFSQTSVCSWGRGEG